MDARCLCTLIGLQENLGKASEDEHGEGWYGSTSAIKRLFVMF